MRAVTTIEDFQQYPDAHHVSSFGESGYMVYGAEQDGVYPAIALIDKAEDGRSLVISKDGTYEQLATKLALIDPAATTEAADPGSRPIYRTTVEFIHDGQITQAVYIGPYPKGATLYGWRILSIELAADWTLEKILDLESEIVQNGAEG